MQRDVRSSVLFLRRPKHFWTAVLVSPGDDSWSLSLLPTFQAIGTSQDASNVQLQWEWDDSPLFTNPNGRKQTETTTEHTSGSTVSNNPPSNLVDGVTYYWRVRAGDGTNWGTWSATWSLNLDTTSGYGYGYMYVNVGGEDPGPQEGYGTLTYNVGINPPPSNGYGYMYFNEVSTNVPTPELWFVEPTAGYDGQTFTLYGQGFGALQSTYSGTVRLIDVDGTVFVCTVLSWDGNVAGDPGADHPLLTLDHGEIVARVPAADVGEASIIVRTDA